MYYANIATISTKPGQQHDFLRKIETELLPTYRQKDGFVAYTIATTGDSTAVSFGVWQQRAQADQAILVSDKWLQEDAGKLVESLHDKVGELAVYSAEFASAASRPVAAVRPF